MPPTNSPNGAYIEQPILDYDIEQRSISAQKRSDIDTEFLNESEEVYPLPNVRRRRQNDEQGRLLSQTAFNRITETLGALNKVGSFFLNMTREVKGEQNHRGDMQLISSSSSLSDSVNTKKPTTAEQSGIFSTDISTSTQHSHPDALLTITNNLLRDNVTKTIEPLIKRVGISQTEKESKMDTHTLNEKIDMAALEEKKRKKHQAIGTKKETVAPHTTVSTTVAPGNQTFQKASRKPSNKC